MKITLACFGRCKDERLLSLEAEYAKRLPREWGFHIQEIPFPSSASLDAASKAKKESQIFFAKYYSDEYLICLDEEGKQYASLAFAAFIEKQILPQTKDAMFLIGPAEGIPQEILDKAHAKLSLSPLTFPHEFCRLLMLEQIYRASSILRGHPYHKS